KRKNPASVKKRHTGTSVMSYIATPNRDWGSVGAAGRDANLFPCGESCAFECLSRPIKADPLAGGRRRGDPGRMLQPLRKFLFQPSQLRAPARSAPTHP